MLDQFSRTRLVIGKDAMDVLASSRVAVFGIGGVGGHAADALARCGIGHIDIVDDDDVQITNVNRQVIATLDTVGRSKVEVMHEHIASINPACEVTAHKCFYLPETAGQFDFTAYDYVVDCVDTVTAKLQIIEQAADAGTPAISSMGAANKLDPLAFEVGDIYETSVCPLARIIRKECRKRGIEKLKVVYSTEAAITPAEDEMQAAVSAEGPQARQSRHGIPGSIAFVPATAGLIIASEVVKDLIGRS